MRILFNMLWQSGHINPTFPLAHALQARGHDVVYAAVPSLQRAIEARGFRVAPIHRDVLSRREPSDQVDFAESYVMGALPTRVAEEYLSGKMEAFMRNVDPAIVLADVCAASPLGLVAHRQGIPYLQLSTSFSQRLDELPPVTSGLPPTAIALELQCARWEASVLQRHLLTGNLLVPRIPTATCTAYYADLLATKFAYPAESLSFDAAFCVAYTSLPEAVLAPSALDYPRARSAKGDGPIYLAVPVEMVRPETIPAALDEFVDDERPLVYASLGSESERYAGAAPFFRAMIDTFRARPDWQGILVIGRRSADDPVFDARPPNLLLVPYAPQLWLLQRAGAFVTHAGLGGVREAIAHHVPMVTVPQEFDQPGNAARVAFHGLGIHLPPEALSAATLTDAIARVLSDRSYRERLRAMDAACGSEDGTERGADLVERMAARSGRAAFSVPAPGSTLRNAAEAASEKTGSAPVEGWVFLQTSGQDAAGFTLAPGSVLHAPSDQPLEVGSGGYTMSPDLAEALTRAAGPLLAHVQLEGDILHEAPHVVGRTIRCLSMVDVSAVLYDYAAWCAETALQAEPRTSPRALARFRAALHAQRTAWTEGATTATLAPLRYEAMQWAMPLWFRGYAAAVASLLPDPHDAARTAHVRALEFIARRAVEDDVSPGEAAGQFDARYAAERSRFASELRRRVDDCVRAATLA